MKNKLTSHLWKITTAALLTVMLFVGVVCATDVNGKDAYAAETEVTTTDVTPENVDYKLIQYSSITRTKDTETGLYNDVPEYPLEDEGEWLFAGWYTDTELTTHLTRSDTEATNVYAKFVSADILTVKCQISKTTQSTSESTVLRCVSSVDSLKYNKIGFDIDLVQSDEEGGLVYNDITDKSDNKVGVRIYANTEEDAYTYSPKVVDTESEYFFSTTITVIKDDFDEGHLIKPYWITKDGTKVYGVSRYVTVNEGLVKNTIHAAIKMDAPTSEGEYSVSVDGASAVTYIGHDGTYAHFAISVSDRTALNSVTKFVISDADSELGTYYYRNLLTTYEVNEDSTNSSDSSWYTAYEDEEGNLTEDEFVVVSNADFYGMGSVITDTFSGKTIYLASDIVANDVTVTDNQDGTKSYAWTTQYNWSPLASSSRLFAGTFDGQGHTIKGIYHSSSDQYIGLFAATSSGSVVKNFNLTDSQIIKQDTSTANYYLGSVTGCGYGTYEDIYTDATVQGATTKNTQTQCIGGIVGVAYKDEIKCENCHYAGNISTVSTYIGGIIGMLRSNSSNGSDTLYDNITNCIFSGGITTTNSSPYLGGICGYVNRIRVCKITDCVSVGTLEYSSEATTTYIGSVVGCESADKSSYSFTLTITGTVTNIATTTLPQVGNTDETVATETTEGNIGLPTIYSGADFDLTWYDMTPGGYVIEDAEDFYGVYLLSLAGETYEGDILRLGKDITLATTEESTEVTANWTPIEEFAGTLDGQGYSIEGICVVDGSAYAGIFRKLTGATIKNICIDNSTFALNGAHYVAAVAGQGYGTFEKVRIAENVTVTLTGGKQSAAGMLALADDGETTFTECWNAGAITNQDSTYAGGFVSKVSDKITFTDCLNTGAVYAKGGTAGGFIAWYNTTAGCDMIRCVNSGDITIGSGERVCSFVGNVAKTGMTINRCYNTKAGLTLFYANLTPTFANGSEAEDCIDGTGLAADTFGYLDSSVWTITDGVAPTLKCFE